ncbi:MAG: hypothetical protein JWR16_790 [Nevskia sp.]|nr:hypothetical protein [Nevskia sp.]
MQGAAHDFAAAADALIAAESTYFDQIQSASDEAHLLAASADYVGKNGSFVVIAAEFDKHDDFSKAKALRVKALAQLGNYARCIDAIGNGGEAPWLRSDVQATGASVDSLLADSQAAKLSKPQADAIRSAVADLAQLVVAKASIDHLQHLAEQAKAPIAAIANMIERDEQLIEADQFAPGLKTDQHQDTLNILHLIYDDPKVDSAQRLLAIHLAFANQPRIVSQGAMIREALTKLQAANDAIASGHYESAYEFADQAFGMAQRALDAAGPKS